MAAARRPRVCVGAFAGAHGVHGLVRLKSFTERPDDIFAYGPLTDEAGERVFRLEPAGEGKEGFLVRIEGVADREAAEALKGVRLYVDRAALPEPGDDEFYYTDLVGLAAERTDGSPLGTVIAVQDFGAVPLLEIRIGREAILVPFTREAVPVVDIPAGRVVVEPPPGLLHGETEDGEV